MHPLSKEAAVQRYCACMDICDLLEASEQRGRQVARGIDGADCKSETVSAMRAGDALGAERSVSKCCIKPWHSSEQQTE